VSSAGPLRRTIPTRWGEVQRAVARGVTLPEGYFVTYGGQFENQERAMKRLMLIVLLVLLLIVGFLYASS